MKDKDLKELQEIILLECKEGVSDSEAEHAAKVLLCFAKKLKRLALADCNVGLTDSQEEHWSIYEYVVFSVCRNLGLGCEVQGDPRGYVACVMTPKSGRSNRFIGEHWGIA